jgi:hypothetical protein
LITRFTRFIHVQVVEPIAQRLTMMAGRSQLKPAVIVDSLALWLGWTGLTWLAFGVSLLFIEVGEKSDLSLADGLLGGCLTGLAQWQALRPYLRNAHRWMVANTLSWGALVLFQVGAIGWMAPGTPSLILRAIFGIFYGGYVGLGLGIGQWLVLRGQVAQAWRWIPLSSGIWAVAIALGWLTGGALRLVSNLFVSEVIGLLVAWGAIAALSGMGLVGLLIISQSLPKTQLPRHIGRNS